MTMDELFEEQPEHWGLRGDPYAWEALRQHLVGVPVPDDDAALEGLLGTAFASVVGVDLRIEPGENVYRDEFAHGGMSSGHVCLSTWRERLIPLLVSRALRTRAAGARPSPRRKCGWRSVCRYVPEEMTRT